MTRSIKSLVPRRPRSFCCSYTGVPEQKARTTYDNILRLSDDPDVKDAIRFLREREIVHYQRFGEALRYTQEQLDCKNFYAFNPNFDRQQMQEQRQANRSVR